MSKCKCKESMHSHDGKVCDIDIADTEIVCPRCGINIQTAVSNDEIDDMGLRD